MALSARISPRSLRGRCKCPSGTKKVFVGDSGVRCGKVKAGRFTFVKTPKSCNSASAAKSAAKRRRKKSGTRSSAPSCKYGKLKTPVGNRVCKKKPQVPKSRTGRRSSHEMTMRAARRSPGRFAGYDYY
jgi:hypothetical protein